MIYLDGGKRMASFIFKNAGDAGDSSLLLSPRDSAYLSSATSQRNESTRNTAILSAFEKKIREYRIERLGNIIT